MQIIPSFNPNAAPGGDIEVGAADAGSKLLLYNLSLVAIKLNFDNGGVDILHAGEARYWILDGSTPVIQWSQYSVLVANQPPISIVTGTLYGAHEPLPGTYPVALQYQTNVGNNVPLSGSTTSIVNDGNPAGQSVVEATQVGSSGSNVSLSNDGTLVLASYITGVLAQFFKSVPSAVGGASVLLLGDSSRQVEVLGALKVDGTAFTGVTQIFGALTAKSTASLDNGAITTDGAGNITTSGGATIGGLLTINNVIKNSVPALSVAGTAGGNISVFQTMNGLDQRIKIVFNNWNTTAGTTQTIALPTAFSGTGWWTVGAAANGIEALLGGVAQTFNAVTSLGSTNPGGTTPLTIIKANSLARSVGGFDTLRFTGSGSAVSGLTIIEG